MNVGTGCSRFFLISRFNQLKESYMLDKLLGKKLLKYRSAQI